jgi:hypothetical protein
MNFGRAPRRIVVGESRIAKTPDKNKFIVPHSVISSQRKMRFVTKMEQAIPPKVTSSNSRLCQGKASLIPDGAVVLRVNGLVFLVGPFEVGDVMIGFEVPDARRYFVDQIVIVCDQ